MAEPGGTKNLVVVTVCIILMMVLTGGCLEEEEDDNEEKIIAHWHRPIEYSWGYKIEFGSFSEYVKIEDIELQALDPRKNTIYSLSLTDSNPPPFMISTSTIYAMTLGELPVQGIDNETIDSDDLFNSYIFCYITYIDGSSDGIANPGDYLYIYRDYNGDGVDDISEGYSIHMIFQNRIVMKQTL